MSRFGRADSDEEVTPADVRRIDTTDVIGRRMGAWIINVGLLALAVLVPMVLLADSYTVPGLDRGPELDWIDGDLAVFFRSSVLILHTSELALALAAALVVAVPAFILWPGRHGWSPGHLAADLRVIDADGDPPGPGRALARTLAWVIDILPGVPLVGLVTMRTTAEHQRVGDLVAGTRVVHHHPAGRKRSHPVVMTEDTDRPPLDGGSAPERLVATAAPPAGITADEPMWDRGRERYVMWHSGHGGWLAYSDRAGRWEPVGDHPDRPATPSR